MVIFWTALFNVSYLLNLVAVGNRNVDKVYNTIVQNINMQHLYQEDSKECLNIQIKKLFKRRNYSARLFKTKNKYPFLKHDDTSDKKNDYGHLIATHSKIS